MMSPSLLANFNRRRLAGLLAGAALVGLSACAGPPLPTGDRLLRGGDFASAVEALREEAAARPEDAVVRRNLGVALAGSGDAASAVAALREAIALDPEDPLSHYFLGRAAETAGDPRTALAGYAAYRDLTGKNPPELRVRIRELSGQLARLEIEQAIAAERNLETLDTSPSTVAVPAYASLVQDSDLAPLGRGLAVVLISDLSKVSGLRVVERARMNVLLDELSMAAPPPPSRLPEPEPRQWSPIASVRGMKERLAVLRNEGGSPFFGGTVDDARDAAFVEAVKAFQASRGLTADGIPGPRTQNALKEAMDALPAPETVRGPAVAADSAPRLGRLLGAGRLVQGAFVPGGETIELEASVVATTSGEVTPGGSPVSGPLPEVLQLQKQLTYQILGALGVEATPDERKEIDKLPTRSFEAFLAYSRGLDFEARGMSREAFDAFRQAVTLDPDFDIAQEEVELGEVTPQRERDFGAGRQEEIYRVPADPAPRLAQTGFLIGIGPGPDRDIGDDLDPSITPVEKIENAVIVIEGRLPKGVQR